MRQREKEMLERHVQQGVKWLNENEEAMPQFEEWYRKISTTTLNMGSGAHCMVGQLLGEYCQGMVALSKVYDYIHPDEDGSCGKGWATQHGFLVEDHYRRGGDGSYTVVDYDYRDNAYYYLTQLWRDAILHEQLERSLERSLEVKKNVKG